MELIDRYLHAVKGHLPLKQQDDVIAELAEDLRSRIDDREAELGRRLNEDEVVTILRQVGHPAHLAARYGSWQQLIGPALLLKPVWRLGQAKRRGPGVASASTPPGSPR